MNTTLFDTLNELIESEISAVETYLRAIRKIGGGVLEEDLRRIKEDHMEAAGLLRKHVEKGGGEAEARSRVWDSWTRLTQEHPKHAGGKDALNALREGEEQGINAYEDAMRDDAVDFATKHLIDSVLLPKARDRLDRLDDLLEA